MPRTIVPLVDLTRRPPEAGRIRLGVKTAKAMKSIETFRFTSRHQRAIEQIAEQHGGDVRPWSDPKARMGANQFEVITTSNEIPVMLPLGGLSCWYEQWTGGGVSRRCDGVTAEIPGREEMIETPCVCFAKGVQECKPYTRMNVVLPNVDFFGTWRLESKGWNAAQELPGMFDMITELAQQGNMMQALLHLEPRTTVTNGRTKKFVTPTLSIAATPQQMLDGGGMARPQLANPETPGGDSRILDTAPQRGISTESVDSDDVAEAEIVDLEREQLAEEKLRSLAGIHQLDEQGFVDGVWIATAGDVTKIEAMLKRADEGRITPRAINHDGTIDWVVAAFQPEGEP